MGMIRRETPVDGFGPGFRKQRRSLSDNDAGNTGNIFMPFQRRKKKELEQARMAGAGDQQVQQIVRAGDKVGRNDPCPCGSGKKYKHCHGK